MCLTVNGFKPDMSQASPFIVVSYCNIVDLTCMCGIDFKTEKTTLGHPIYGTWHKYAEGF